MTTATTSEDATPLVPRDTVYVDEVFKYPMEATALPARAVAKRNNGLWCHMWCDPGKETALHHMADRLGLKRAWFQNKPGFPHYDLTPGRRVAAVLSGCKEMRLTDWLKRRQESRLPQ